MTNVLNLYETMIACITGTYKVEAERGIVQWMRLGEMRALTISSISFADYINETATGLTFG